MIKKSLPIRLILVCVVFSLHAIILWVVFTLMAQQPAVLALLSQMPPTPPLVIAQVFQQLPSTPTRQPPPALPTPAPLPKQRPPHETPKPAAIPSEHALTTPKQEPSVATQEPVEKTASAAPAQTAAPAPPASIVAPRFNAAYLNNPQPIYPPILLRTGQGGKVMLNVYVTIEGNAGDVRILTGSGSSLFDEAALKAVRQWRFVPAHQGDTAVAGWFQIPIVFKPPVN